MSNVRVNDRKPSKVEFDNTYYKIYDDAVNLIELNFGADKRFQEEHKSYLEVASKKIYAVVYDIGTNIRIANSIYPTCQSEAKERRLHQEKAIGLCYDLLTKYNLVMRRLKIRDDKYTLELKNVTHEINCLKRWKESDDKRYKNLG